MVEGNKEQAGNDEVEKDTSPEEFVAEKTPRERFSDDYSDTLKEQASASKGGLAKAPAETAGSRPVEEEQSESKKDDKALSAIVFDNKIYPTSSFSKEGKGLPTDSFTKEYHVDYPTESTADKGLAKGRLEEISTKKDGTAPDVVDPKAKDSVPAVDTLDPKAKGAGTGSEDTVPQVDVVDKKGIVRQVDVAPKAKGDVPQGEVVAPKAKGDVPQAEVVDPKAKGNIPQTEVVDPKAKGNIPQTEVVDPKAKGNIPQTEVVDPKAKGNIPQAEVVDPKAKRDSTPDGTEQKGDQTPKREKTPEEKMLDPKTSNEEKIRIADEMYRKGQKSFKGPDGKKYDITEAKVGERRLVAVFGKDQNGNSKPILRGIVEKDGKVSKQQDSKGRQVDFESSFAKKTDGAGLRNPEKTPDPKQPDVNPKPEEQDPKPKPEEPKVEPKPEDKVPKVEPKPEDKVPKVEPKPEDKDPKVEPKPEDKDPKVEPKPEEKDPKAEPKPEERQKPATKPEDDGIIRGIDPKDGSKFERKPDGKGGYVETHTGDKPEQKYTKADDGKGNIIVTRQDGTGYTRTEQPGGAFSEAHFGPKPSDFKTVTGDGKGNNVEVTTDGKGNHREKHTFADPNKNFTKEVLADKTVIETDSKGNRTTTSGDGKTIKFEGTDGKTLTETKTDNGFVETHTGPKPEDNWSVERKNDGKGGYTEQYKFKDETKNYQKDVTSDGKVVITDNVGLKLEMHNASPEFQQKMLKEVQKIPEADRKIMAASGYRVAIVGKISDLDPKLANERPRGWPEGKTWNDADGAHMVDRKLIVVAENTNSGPSRRGEGVLRHEMGHAMDWALNKFSNDPEFLKAYEEDVKNMPEGDKSRNLYLLQTGNAGREETFADVYGAINGAPSNPWQKDMVLKNFPRVAEAIRKKLGRG